MVRIGTCSWKYPSWAGIVYSRPEGIDYLAEYARRFSTVEIDQWFWSMPRREQVESYAASVPPSFRFTVKAFNGLTWATLSGRQGAPPEASPRFLSPDLLRELAQALEPLGDRLGLVMLQFEYLNKKKMASREEFLRRLDVLLASVPRGLSMAVETRNGNYLSDDYFALLRERGAGHVFLQGYWMPDVAEIYGRFRDLLSGRIVVRLHGPDREGMEERAEGRWDRILTPRDKELGAIAEMVKDLDSRGKDVYLNVNNHYEGSAPLTIERLEALGVADMTGRDGTATA